MKATRESRTIHLTGVPHTVGTLKDLPTAYSICINYRTDDIDTPLGKAISLDSIIIPLILKALNTEE